MSVVRATGFTELKRGAMARLLAAIESSRLLDGVGDRGLRFLSPIVAVAHRHRRWCRDPEDWVCPRLRASRQFASLVRHLFATYPVPAFLDLGWLNGDTRYQNWFLHVGRGESIRTAAGLPIPMTRRMAHLFMHADGVQPETVIRWTQVRAKGGDDETARAVCATPLGHRYLNDEFWRTVIQFFINHPELEKRHYGPIVDYIHDQRFERRRRRLANGCLEEHAIAQPNFSMRGRRVGPLLRAVEQWHDRLYQHFDEPEFEDFAWEPSGLSAELPRRLSESGFELVELMSTSDLWREGRKLHHCVVSYAPACRHGPTAIFSMRCDGESLVTLEVNTHLRRVVQARGSVNELPSAEQMEVINAWASREGLDVDPDL